MKDDHLHQLLDRYFDGTLDAEAKAELESELLTNRVARAAFWQHARLEEALRSDGAQAKGERRVLRMQDAERKPAWGRRIAAMAAVLAISAGSFLLWNATRSEKVAPIAIVPDTKKMPKVEQPDHSLAQNDTGLETDGEPSSFPAVPPPEVLSIGNELSRRELSYEGGVWRTTKFIVGSKSLDTQSDEFHIRLMDDREWTVGNFQSDGEPVVTQDGKTSVLTIRYKWPDKVPDGAPENVIVRYTATPGEAWTRKTVALIFAGEATVDRLEVERFSAAGKATRGGRGEPVFLDNRWFFGLEYPAGHSRHTDGNTPAADKHHYELVANYSYINLDGRDVDTRGRAGLIRLFHFPGYAVKNGPKWQIVSKTAVAGGGMKAQVTEQFADYLKKIQKPDRSYTHYNNWFDPAGKSLKGDNLVQIYRSFMTAVKPYGVKIDSMVPDDGWQNRKSVWEPKASDFPNGFDDLKKLSESLLKEGSSLGLWLSLNGKNNDVSWGQTQGFAEAKLNRYFSQYGRVFSLSHPAYREKLEKELVHLAGEGKIGYFKHDFNHLSDTGEGNGHPATDRHGHEANVDAMIGLLKATRAANPNVYQNLTNWMWFSPWWLMHGDALWMLAGDDGENGNWPEISGRAMATTDRDTFLWRMWGDAADRPLVPISRLMTHGIILNQRRQLESSGDGIREWADHVMMYYGRGIQMKEWYITPKVSTPEHWKALGTIHRWSEKNFKALANTVWFGGRPDEGNVYGYMGWDGAHAVLVTRNPSAQAQKLVIPFDANSGFHGQANKPFHGRVVYPYHEEMGDVFQSGKTITVEVPGYATLAFEFDPGAPKTTVKPLADIPVKSGKTDAVFTVPADITGRAEILVMGYPTLPEVKINGQKAEPKLTSKGSINQFAGYARAGMPSAKARPWEMASYDVKSLVGKEVQVSLSGVAGDDEATSEAFLLVDRKGTDASFPEVTVPWAIDAGMRRQTVRLFDETRIAGVAEEVRALTAAELSSLRSATLTIDLFGVNPASAGEKTVWLNGRKIAELPVGGDAWKKANFALEKEALQELKAINVLEIRRSTGEDKFKFRGAVLRVQLADGSTAVSTRQKQAQTTDADWAFNEGTAFPSVEKSAPVQLEFTSGN